ncbi:DNA polymerase III subunit epsilon [Corynebacterium phocae]|uniref:DNA polymerase III subunit epsilon n=1 Tax=Corynebacterium phocae TaxID=161895 RepID=A0A1L7D2P7_9CORY|nr:exonuclease domain-containing protein [Corynebacterium phocae]APT92261.1 DNA polymerase III subunit epsilon [Corynebacterium phocae]KAA8725409.1 DNA polymerase III subunit epsilon [Corynebacterium phocae]
MFVAAHGATLTATKTTLIVEHSQLSRSLGCPERLDIALESITGLEHTEPGAATFGTLAISRSDAADVVIRFAPGSSPQAARDLIAAAQRGELSAAAIPGLDFTAVDVETANDNWGSICQVGAVRFRSGQETAARTWLCTPPPGLDKFLDVNISIHGIRPADVADAAPFVKVLAEIVEFIGRDTVVAHNAQFDGSALRLACRASQQPVPDLKMACSLALARDASRAGAIKVENHKLPTVVRAVGAADFTHHDATEDARAAGAIITALAATHGHQGSIADLFTARGFVLGSVSESQVFPVLRQHTAPLSAADTGAGTDFRDPPAAKKPAPPRNQPAPWDAVATPSKIPEANLDADPQGPLFGQNVTLTGDFAPFDKGAIWEAIAQQGAKVGKSVTKKTTVLVLGTWATKTSKEKRAEELIAKGQDIALWSKEQLFETLDLFIPAEEDIQPPF